MKKFILIVFVTIFTFSCKTSKKLVTSDKGTTETTVDKSTIIRPGEVITIDIPNIRYKDTVITRTNYETRSVATVYYDKDGNQRFDCQTGEIQELKEIVSILVKNNVKSSDESKTSFNPQYFIYALAAFGLVICVLFYMVIRIQKNAPEMTARLVNELLKSKQ